MGFTDGFLDGSHQLFTSKTKKVILTNDMTFLCTSYGEFNKLKNKHVFKLVMRGSDDRDLKSISENININKEYNAVYNSISNEEEEEEEEEGGGGEEKGGEEEVNSFEQEVSNNSKQPPRQL